MQGKVDHDEIKENISQKGDRKKIEIQRLNQTLGRVSTSTEIMMEVDDKTKRKKEKRRGKKGERKPNVSKLSPISTEIM